MSIGLHVFKDGDIVRSIARANNEFALDAVQIFTHGPRSKAKVKHDYDALAALEVPLYVHSSYVTSIWKGSVAHALEQFESAKEINAIGVVLHIPKITPDKVAEGTAVLAKALAERNIKQKIILEMKAVSKHATKSYETPEKINRLIKCLEEHKLSHDQVGICVDTAHIYAGQAQVGTYEQATQYLAALDPKWICLIHLNGNAYDANVRAGDKHAIPFDRDDLVWKNVKYKESGCKAFIEWSRKNKINFILEVKAHHTVKQIHAFTKIMK